MKIIELTENKFRKSDTSEQEITRFVDALKALKLKAFTQVGVSPKQEKIAKFNLQSSPGQKDLIFFNDFPTKLFVQRFITAYDNRLGKELDGENGAQNFLRTLQNNMAPDDPFIKRLSLQDAEKIKALWDQMSERTRDRYSKNEQQGYGPGF